MVLPYGEGVVGVCEPVRHHRQLHHLEWCPYQRHPPTMNVLVRVFTIIFCIFVMLAEIFEGFFTKTLTFLLSWVGKGIVEMFLGVLTFSYTGTYNDPNWPTVVMIASWVLIGTGLIYFVLGIFGGKEKKEKRKSGEKK